MVGGGLSGRGRVPVGLFSEAAEDDEVARVRVAHEAVPEARQQRLAPAGPDDVRHVDDVAHPPPHVPLPRREASLTRRLKLPEREGVSGSGALGSGAMVLGMNTRARRIAVRVV